MKTAITALWILAAPLLSAQEPASQLPADTHALVVPSVQIAQRPIDLEALEPSSDICEILEDVGQYIEETMVEPAHPSEETAAFVLDVKECVDLALAQNSRIAVAEEDLEAAQARIGQARAGRLPQVRAQTALVHTELNQQEQTGLSSFLSSGMSRKDDLRRDRITLDQVIYAGGRIGAAVKASQYLAQSQEWQKEAALAAVEYDAKQAYYDVMLASALVRVAEESIVTYERQLSDTQEMFDVGVKSRFEVLRAQTELEARRADLVTAHDAERLALENLRRVLFLPRDTPIRLNTDLKWLLELPLTQAPYDYAVEHRPELVALEKAIAAAGQDIRRRKGEYLPQVGASAQYENTYNGGALSPDGWTFTLAADLDIFTGSRRKHQVHEARARMRSLQHQLDDLRRLVELDIAQSLIQIQDAIAQLKSEHATVQLAREGLRLAELRFEEGVGTQGETLDAELALTAARSNVVQAVRNYFAARASLERAIGKSWRTLSETAPENAGDEEMPATPQETAESQDRGTFSAK